MSLRSLALGALGCFILLFARPTAAAPSSAFDASPYLHAQRLIDVGGGRRMNLYCTGRGNPTVVLGTDGDDGTPAWRFVQPLLAKRTRVCSYDSEGLGFSDPAKPPLDASLAVTDLHTLLSRASIAPPYVLVGYALSGLYARLYADRYPREVAGMVLVAPNVTDQTKRIAAVAPALARCGGSEGIRPLRSVSRARRDASRYAGVRGVHVHAARSDDAAGPQRSRAPAVGAPGTLAQLRIGDRQRSDELRRSRPRAAKLWRSVAHRPDHDEGHYAAADTEASESSAHERVGRLASGYREAFTPGRRCHRRGVDAVDSDRAPSGSLGRDR